MASVNMMNIRRQANVESRRASGGSFNYNPFRHSYIKPAKRATTLDVERGESDKYADTAGLAHSNSAPGYFRGHEPGVGLDSQDSTIPDSPIPNGDGTRDRDFVGGRVGAEGGGLRCRGTTGSAAGGGSSEPNAEEPEEKLKYGFIRHVEPKEPFTWKNQLRRTVGSSWINVLLLCAPAGIAINYAGVNGQIVFAVNFIAIIPLAAMLGFATEEIALRTGEALGGLINATFGNAVELIVAIIALADGQVIVVQTSLIGSILSNLLLVLGMCFLLGGYNRSEQYFNTTVAQTAASMLALAVGSLIIPTVFTRNTGIVGGDVAKLSHGVAIILLFVYGCYLLFQLKTHSEMFNEESQKVPGKQYDMPGKDVINKVFKKREPLSDNAIASGLARSGAGAAFTGAPTEHRNMQALMMGPNTHGTEEAEDEDEGPQLHIAVAFAQMTIVTVVIAFCAEAMVSGIDAIVESGTVSEEFVGLILLPIVGNACEHATAVTVAVKDKMDLAIGVAIGSSMQVALFLVPLLVIIGWAMGNEYMNLAFDDFQVVVLFVSVLLVNYLISDGKSHWLEGMLLVCLYFIIAVCTWWYPADLDPTQPGIQAGIHS
ncbi:hypothetical protein DL771_010783 [Monosporascus sp. 5C6A]|nr:hypothetical protein DL771_010783 [Monosporascus sp. 5C6A]